MKDTWGAAGVIVSGLVMIVLLYGLAALAKWAGLEDHVGLPLLAISGVVLLISILALMAIAYSMFDLDDKTQALGLPEGSVRAVIALSLVLLFAILAVYLYSSLASGGVMQTVKAMTPQQTVALLKVLQDTPSSIANETTGELMDATAVAALAKAVPTSTDRLSISYRPPQNQAAVNFATQLVAIIGTLVTSVAGFYFGSKTAGTGQGSGTSSPTPVLRSISPTSAKTGTGPTAFTLNGDSLNQIANVKIVLGSKSIAGTDVISNEGTVEFKIDFTGAAVGNWDVIATDAFGKSVKLPGALTVLP
jgi:hypothetical protein